MKTNTLFLLFLLVTAQTFAQKTELKEYLLINETFDGDTFNNVFSFGGKPYTRKTSEFARLKMTPGCRVELNSDSLKRKLSNVGGKYDSLQVEISFAHRFGLMNKVGFVYANSHTDFVFNDVDTHVVKATYYGVQNQDFFAFKNYDSSTSIYVNYVKIYGYRIDTIPTTGIKEELNEAMSIYSYENIILVNNPDRNSFGIVVYDATGKIIAEAKGMETKMEIQLQKPTGIYIVVLSDDRGNKILKRVYLKTL